MFSRRSGRKGDADMSCVFVHAGAGYHSKENERNHLQACSDACKSAMLILKNGGSAVDAAEMAIRVLEDREITNAGYGSNPNIDGVVECDAVVVDHLGRSGAVGAVAQIKNPVSLARVLLDCTSQPLSLRRVPPNLLVGEGATNFAHDHGIPVLPYSYLVSPSAKQRWQKWRAELMRAERIDGDSWIFRPSASLAEVERELDMYYSEAGSAEASRIKHERAMLLSMLHSGHPITPLSPAPSDSRENNLASLRSPIASLNDRMRPGSGTTTPESEAYLDPVGPPGMLENTARNPFANSTQQIPSTASLSRIVNSDGAAEGGAHMNEIGFHRKHDSDFHFEEQLKDDMSMTGTDTVSGRGPLEQSRRAGDTRQAFTRSSIDVTETCSFSRDEEHTIPDREDHITDTIGAIAVDRHGNIACAASSGGISMKHRGRVGPAALIGVGAFVIPVNTNDPDRTSVAAVTSGTGEHMATTFAAHAAAQRIYHPRRPRNVRRSSATPSGHSSRASSGPASPISDDVEIESWPSSSSLRSTGSSPAHPTSFEEPCDEPEALQAFITSDFLGHPSVRHSHSAGAIGALVVKKTLDGIWLYFAHNTDSFALASMHGEEPRPVCTMSRKSNDRAASGNAGLAHGGRGMRFGRSSGGRTR